MRDNETRSMWLDNDTEVEIGYEYLRPERTVVLTQYDFDHKITGRIRFGIADFEDMMELLNAVKPAAITGGQINASTITADWLNPNYCKGGYVSD